MNNSYTNCCIGTTAVVGTTTMYTTGCAGAGTAACTAATYAAEALPEAYAVCTGLGLLGEGTTGATPLCAIGSAIIGTLVGAIRSPCILREYSDLNEDNISVTPRLHCCSRTNAATAQNALTCVIYTAGGAALGASLGGFPGGATAGMVGGTSALSAACGAAGAIGGAIEGSLIGCNSCITDGEGPPSGRLLSPSSRILLAVSSLCTRSEQPLHRHQSSNTATPITMGRGEAPTQQRMPEP
jgi:hypothetical protein